MREPAIPRLAAAEAALAALLPPGAAVAAFDPRAPAPPPWPGECAGPGRVAPARAAEFAAGRAALRRAMARLGLPPAALPVGPGRAPLWPQGVTGSLTHTATLGLAAVAPAGGVAGLGIDAEPDAPLPPELWEAVLRPEERAALAALPPEARGQRARLVFVAKEALHKAQYPATGRLIGFEAVRIEVSGGDLRAVFVARTGRFAPGAALAGRWAAAAGHVVAAVVAG